MCKGFIKVKEKKVLQKKNKYLWLSQWRGLRSVFHLYIFCLYSTCSTALKHNKIKFVYLMKYSVGGKTPNATLFAFTYQSSIWALHFFDIDCIYGPLYRLGQANEASAHHSMSWGGGNGKFSKSNWTEVGQKPIIYEQVTVYLYIFIAMVSHDVFGTKCDICHLAKNKLPEFAQRLLEWPYHVTVTQ